MEIKVFYVPGISHFSYAIIGQKGIAVIDPKRIIDDYLDLQRSASIPITHVLLTHTHADFISGHLLLAEATGARVVLPSDAGDGFELDLGDVLIRSFNSPGHTPDHVSYLLYEKEYGTKVPFAVFTGDSLFSGDVGRPDLFGEKMREQLTRQLFETMERYRAMPDHVLVYPAHGAGSFCGKRLSQRCPTTIGYERLHNPALRTLDYEEFERMLLESMPSPPPYYFVTSRRNREQEGLDRAFRIPMELKLSSLQGHTVVDLRDQACFAACHIPGSFNIAADIHFAMGAGFVLDPDQSLVLVGSEDEVFYASRVLFMMGFDRVEGAVYQAVEKWRVASLPYSSFKLISPKDAYRLLKEGSAVVVDVRTEAEFAEGHIPGAVHIPLVSLKKRLGDLPDDRLVIFQCGHGCRGSLAASVALKEGIENVANMAGGFVAWKAAGLPVEGA